MAAPFWGQLITVLDRPLSKAMNPEPVIRPSKVTIFVCRNEQLCAPPSGTRNFRNLVPGMAIPPAVMCILNRVIKCQQTNSMLSAKVHPTGRIIMQFPVDHLVTASDDMFRIDISDLPPDMQVEMRKFIPTMHLLVPRLVCDMRTQIVHNSDTCEVTQTYTFNLYQIPARKRANAVVDPPGAPVKAPRLAVSIADLPDPSTLADRLELNPTPGIDALVLGAAVVGSPTCPP